nr:hypothetical protein [uncultured Flavobacterium sp.]
MNSPELNNYIQYVTRSGIVKAKSVTFQDNGLTTTFDVAGIIEDFFIFAVFQNNLQRFGIGFENFDNINMLSFINSSIVDLACVPTNSFLLSEQVVTMSYNNEYVKKFNSGDPLQFPVLQLVEVDNFPVQSEPKFYKIYDTPQYRGNVISLTNVQLGTGNFKWITQNVFRLDKDGLFMLFGSSHFNNLNGTGGMSTDFSEERVLDVAKVVMVNGMYVKFTCTNPSFAVGYYHFRFAQDVRTNEVYIVFEKGNALAIYEKFDFSTLQCLDGGFSIEHILLGLKIEVRNKFFV